MHVRFCQHLNADLFRLLAWEDMLLDEPLQDHAVVVAWTSPPAVVWGRNQCPWRECNRGLAERMGVHLARRVTGGGTVVQDSGCLNLTFLLPRSRYQAAEVYEVFRRITLPFGVQLERRDTSLYAGAFKVSGHAFAYRRERVLHHGTLLVNTDLARLTPLLVSPFQVVETHAVASNPAPVRNLHEGTIPGLLDELPSALTQVWPDSELSPLGFPHNDPALDTMAARFRSAAWIWQRTPSFSLLMPGGAFRDRSLTITAGRIAAFGNHVPEILQSAWRGLPFEKNVLLEALPLQADPGYLASIRDWVSSW